MRRIVPRCNDPSRYCRKTDLQQENSCKISHLESTKWSSPPVLPTSDDEVVEVVEIVPQSVNFMSLAQPVRTGSYKSLAFGPQFYVFFYGQACQNGDSGQRLVCIVFVSDIHAVFPADRIPACVWTFGGWLCSTARGDVTSSTATEARPASLSPSWAPSPPHTPHPPSLLIVSRQGFDSEVLRIGSCRPAQLSSTHP